MTKVWVALMLLLALLPASAAGASKKLVLSSMPHAGNPQWHMAGAARFMQLHPDVEVEVQQKWEDALITMIAGGTPPDVIHYDGQFLLPFIRRGFFMDLTQYIERDLDLGQFFPALIEAQRYKGGIYALPRSWSVYAQVYNATLFEQRGVSPPDETWAWDDLIEYGKRLTFTTGSDPNDKVYGFAPRWGASNAEPMWLWQAGGQYWNEDYTKSLVDSEEAEMGFQFLVDIFGTYGVAPDPNAGYRNPDALLNEGRIAMTQVTRYTRISHPLYEFAVAPISSGPAGNFTSQVADVLGIFPGSNEKDLAWELVKFLVTEEGFAAGRELGREFGFYWGLSPVRHQAVEQLITDGEVGFEAWLNMVEVARRVDRQHPLGMSGPTGFGSVLSGQLPMRSFLQEAAATLNATIQQALEAGETW